MRQAGMETPGGGVKWEVVSARSEARSGAVQESAGVGVCRVRRKGWARGNKKGHSGAEERPGKAGKSGGMNSDNYPGFRYHAEVETVRGASQDVIAHVPGHPGRAAARHGQAWFPALHQGSPV